MSKADHHDPFIRLTHCGYGLGPLFLLPGNVTEILDGKVYVGNGHFVVKETAEEIHRLVLEKMAENKQAETLGKT